MVGWGSPVRLYHGRVLYGRWWWLERWRSVHTAMEETKYGITQKPHERLFVKCSQEEVNGHYAEGITAPDICSYTL